MIIDKLNTLHAFFESAPDGLSKPFLEAALDGLRAIFESEEDMQADATKAAADIENIDKSIGQTNASADALANAQNHRVQAVQNSPLATVEDKSGIESKAAEMKEQIRQSADAKTAELAERKKAIETNLAAKQAENSQSDPR